MAELVDVPSAAALRRGARRIVALYTTAACAWVVGSDWLLGQLVSDPAWWTRLAVAKGWAFVALSAAALYGLITSNSPWVRRRWPGSDAQALGGLELMRAIADGSTDAIFAKDLQGRYILCNREAARVMGTRVDDVLGRDDTHVFAAEEAAAIMANDRRVIEDDRARTYEELISTPDGLATFLATKGPLRDAAGRVVGMFGISRDITARKRAELALQEANELVQAVEDSVLDHMAVLDSRGVIVAVNAAWRQFAIANGAADGPGARTDVGMNYLDITMAATGPGSERAVEATMGLTAVLSGEQAQFQLEYPCASPTQQRWFQMSVTPLRTSRGGAVVVHADITPRRLAVEAMRASEARMRSMVSVLDEGLVMFRPDGSLIGSNEQARAFFGDDLQRLGDGSLVAHWRPVAGDGRPLAPFELPIARALRGDAACRDLLMGVTGPDEVRRWLLVNAACERDESGAVTAVLGSFRDVTERHLAEAQLRKLSLAVEQNPLGIVIADADGRLEYANDAFTQLSGCAGTAIIGARFDDLLPAIASDAQPWHVQAARHAWSGARDHLRPDGRPCRILLRASPIRQADGRATHRLAILEDITERERTQAELERHRRHLALLVDERTAQLQQLNSELLERERFVHTIADNQPCLLAYWDTELRCRFANRALRDWFGLDEAQIVGRGYAELMPPDAAADDQMHIAAALRGQAQHFQRLVRNAQGTARHSMVSLIPDSVDGRLRGFLALTQDVDEMKRAELELVRVNAELVSSRDSAEAANRAKSSFIANMSHEIRTPMNAIIGLAYLLSRDTTEPVARDRLAKLSDASGHLLQLINDILDLSKIEAGRLELEDAEFSLAELLARCQALVAQRADDKGLRLRVVSNVAPDRLRGDPTRLSQALLNLLSNAVKFTESGCIDVTADVVRAEGEHVQLRLAVRDTGVGIAPDKLDALFHPFVQADASTTRRYGGTGLGLAISKRLVEMMGGAMGVASEPGQGSEFWFTATLARAIGAVDAEAGDDADNATRLHARAAGLRALLVGVDGAPRDGAHAVLAAAAMDVELADNGLAALGRAARERFDLVLVPARLAGMSGLETGRHLRTLPGMADVPIIGLREAADADELACLRAGMTDCVGLPLAPATLRRALLRWLPARATSAAGPVAEAAPAAPLDAELDRLEALLRAGDFGVEAVYRAIRPAFRQRHGAGAIEFEAALAGFDHERAARLLARLRHPARATPDARTPDVELARPAP